MPTQDLSPAPLIINITPSATVNLVQEVRQIYVGAAGNLAVVNLDDSVVVFQNLNAGTTIGPFYIKRVNVSGTTCTGIIGFI